MSPRNEALFVLIGFWAFVLVIFVGCIAMNRYAHDQWDEHVRQHILDARK